MSLEAEQNSKILENVIPLLGMLALEHALLILAANRSLNQSGCLVVVTQQHQHWRIFLTQGLRCLPGLSIFSSHQHCEETLLIDLTFEEHRNCEENRCLTMVSC